jgi:aspartate carbamoyltransferase regulatory subunit
MFTLLQPSKKALWNTVGLRVDMLTPNDIQKLGLTSPRITLEVIFNAKSIFRNKSGFGLVDVVKSIPSRIIASKDPHSQSAVRKASTASFHHT